MAADSNIQVLIADNRTFVRIGVQNVLCDTSDIVVVGMAATRAEALAHIKQLRPEVVVVGDLDDPGMVIDAMEKAELQVLALVNGPERLWGRRQGCCCPTPAPAN